MIVEQVDRRVLGAIAFVDEPTRVRIRTPLKVQGDGVRFARNRSGLYVILDAPGLTTITNSFPVQPVRPAVQLSVLVEDPGGAYLPRRAVVQLPRDADPAHSDQSSSLFQPIEVRLQPSPTARAESGWAVIRASVAATTGASLRGALLRVSRPDGSPLATGLSDGRGEAVVMVPGLPQFTFDQAGGPVLASAIDARVVAVFDPAASSPVDPDNLAARLVELSPTTSPTTQLRLASGQAVFIRMIVPLP